MVNSLRPSDAIWRQWSWTTLAQVMACCLTAPSHYLNQCWLIIRGVLWHTSESSFAGIAQGIDSGYEFEKDILKNIFKSPRGQWVKCCGWLMHMCVSELVHHWFRWWLIAYSVPSHYRSQYWYIVDWKSIWKCRLQKCHVQTILTYFKWNFFDTLVPLNTIKQLVYQARVVVLNATKWNSKVLRYFHLTFALKCTGFDSSNATTSGPTIILIPK